MGSGGAFSLPGEAGAQVFSFEDFGSLNTKANRPAIDDKEFSWNENWMPIGAGNLRTLWAEGANLFAAAKTVIYKYPFNFGSNNYIAVFYSDGTADQVSNPGGVVTHISTTAGAFYNVSFSSAPPQCVQWQAKYLIIAGTNTNLSAGCYYIWDGTNLFAPGTLAPEVNITYSGAQGSYTSAPTISAFGGSGTGATFSAVLDPSTKVITQINVTNPGSGFLATDTVQLAFTGGGSDTSAQANPATLASTSGVSGAIVTAGGTGYTTASVITLSGGGGTGAQLVITGLSNGTITQVSVVATGSGYTSQPTASISVGTGATLSVQINGGQIASISIAAGGTGYTSPPQVIIDPPNSDTLPLLPAQAHATIAAGAVTGIVIDNPGLGYVAGTVINVKLRGGNKAASATVNLMPFGVYGNSLETYQGTIFVVNGNKGSFTAPGTTGQFAGSAGGGSFIASDNFLRNQITSVKQATGFLYLLGDSSVNVISNLQTSVVNNAATTTFNNSNVDPQIGCAWRDTAQVFGRALMFANPSGVYALYGGAAQKVSQQLDGLFANADFNTVTPTAAVCIIYGIPVYLFSFRTLDPFQGIMRTIMAAWDGTRWFISSQIKVPTFISTQEINSQLTAWGSDGTNVFPMFQTPSTSLTKVFQTKLRTEPSHVINKQVNAIYISAEANSGLGNFINVSVDNENGQGTPVTVSLTGNLVFVGSGPITFVGSGPITFTAVGLITTKYAPALVRLSAYGRYLGFTATTTSQDLTVLLLSMLFNEYSPVAP